MSSYALHCESSNDFSYMFREWQTSGLSLRSRFRAGDLSEAICETTHTTTFAILVTVNTETPQV